MNPKLTALLDSVLDGKAVQEGMFQYLDLEQALENREKPEFEKEWLRVFEAVERLRDAKSPSASEASSIDAIREAAFKTTFEIAKQHDVSADVSDDFGLIATALVLGIQDPWLNGLWMAYRQGRYPTGTIKRIDGKLDALIE